MKYREELRIASPPCLPYIGLIKQDLYQVNKYSVKVKLIIHEITLGSSSRKNANRKRLREYIKSSETSCPLGIDSPLPEFQI